MDISVIVDELAALLLSYVGRRCKIKREYHVTLEHDVLRKRCGLRCIGLTKNGRFVHLYDILQRLIFKARCYEIIPYIIEHLLNYDSSVVNCRDYRGNTLINHICMCFSTIDSCKYSVYTKYNGEIIRLYDYIVSFEENSDPIINDTHPFIITSRKLFTMFVDRGADITIANRRHMTPLMTVCYQCRSLHYFNLDLINLLLDHNAKIGVKNNKGETALDYARSTSTLVYELLTCKLKEKQRREEERIEEIMYHKNRDAEEKLQFLCALFCDHLAFFGTRIIFI